MSDTDVFLKEYIFSGMDNMSLTNNDIELIKYLYNDNPLIPGIKPEWDGANDVIDSAYFSTDSIDYYDQTIQPPSETSGKSVKNIRPLSPLEKEILLPVFKNQLNYSKIRIQINGIFTIGKTSRDIGNRICIDEHDLTADGKIDPDTLIHEAAHVWQYQRTMGYHYATRALKGHALRLISFNKYDPYSYEGLEGKVPWDEWNPEAQAQWIMKNKRLPGAKILNPWQK